MVAEIKVGSSVESKRQKVLPSFRELKEELRKINWTTKQELVSSTKAVIWVTVLFGLGIYVVDLGIKGLLDLIKIAMRLLFG